MIDPNASAGWMRPLSVYGVPAAAIKIQCGPTAVDRGDNTYRFERTRRYVRLADVDWYCALFQVAGRSGVIQNEHTVQLEVGDIGLIPDGRRGENPFDHPAPNPDAVAAPPTSPLVDRDVPWYHVV